MPSPVHLDHRAILMVHGEDATAFLQGLITQSAENFAAGEKRQAALLTAQGKVIADMLIEREGDRYLLECDAGISAALLKRLNMFRLRAKVAVEARPDLGVIAFEGGHDPRWEEAPARRIGPKQTGGGMADYHAARIAAGIAEQGIDFASGEIFPADINMDLTGGVDFRKGCFVGQEVVSRMKRRGTARRRTLAVEFAGEVTTPSPVLAGAHEIGTLTSAAGQLGLARLRIDRLAEAEAAGETITAGGVALKVRKPNWLAGELAALHEAKEAR